MGIFCLNRYNKALNSHRLKASPLCQNKRDVSRLVNEHFSYNNSWSSYFCNGSNHS
jgi:hypothetical protein